MKIIRLALIFSLLPYNVFALISEVGSATTSGSGSAVSITHGITILEGDVVLAFVSANTATGVDIDDNNGSTPFTYPVSRISVALVGADNYILIGARVSAGSEPSAYAWTNNAGLDWTVIVRVFRGVAYSIWEVMPEAANLVSSGADGTTATSASIVTATPNSLGVLQTFTDSGVTFSGQTQSYVTEVESGHTQVNQASYIKQIATPGTAPAASVTLSGSNDWEIYQFALKPLIPPIPNRDRAVPFNDTILRNSVLRNSVLR